MTTEEFSKATEVQKWWNDVVHHPHWQLVKEEALRHRRFTEQLDSPVKHIEYKAMAYKEGTHDMLRILNEFCHPSTGNFVDERMSAGDAEATEWEMEQDQTLPDHVQARFTEMRRSAKKE